MLSAKRSSRATASTEEKIPCASEKRELLGGEQREKGGSVDEGERTRETEYFHSVSIARLWFWMRRTMLTRR